jgi:hypothetical protein
MDLLRLRQRLRNGFNKPRRWKSRVEILCASVGNQQSCGTLCRSASGGSARFLVRSTSQSELLDRSRQAKESFFARF